MRLLIIEFLLGVGLVTTSMLTVLMIVGWIGVSIAEHFPPKPTSSELRDEPHQVTSNAPAPEATTRAGRAQQLMLLVILGLFVLPLALALIARGPRYLAPEVSLNML